MCVPTRDCEGILRRRVEDLGPDYATIVQTKNGKSRRVPLTPELRAELAQHGHTSGYVFGQGKSGQPPRQEAISVGRLMRSIGREGVTHHVLCPAQKPAQRPKTILALPSNAVA